MQITTIFQAILLAVFCTLLFNHSLSYEAKEHSKNWKSTIATSQNINFNSSCGTRDSLALIALYNSTGGGSWTNNWTLTDPINTWYGVVASNGCVSAIRLNNNNLVGSLPAEIGDLINLEYLHLFNNQLTGEIPAEIGNLTELEEFICSDNGLTGSIPKEIGNLTKLVFMSLGSNNLTGSIPEEIGNLLSSWHFYLNNNQLSGCFPESLLAFCDFPFKDFSGNPGLPGGGNFDAFCTTQAGVCTDCSTNLSFTNTIPDGLHEAVNIITNGNISVTGDVTFAAEANITLQAGFSVVSGGTFLAKIENCTNNVLKESTSIVANKVNRNVVMPTIHSIQLGLKIKPNPIKHQAVINYDLPTNEIVHLSMFNMEGRLVKILANGLFQEAGKKEMALELTGLTKGIYLVRLQTKKQVNTIKVIVLE